MLIYSKEYNDNQEIPERTPADYANNKKFYKKTKTMEWFFGKATLGRIRDRFLELKNSLTSDLKVINSLLNMSNLIIPIFYKIYY